MVALKVLLEIVQIGLNLAIIVMVLHERKK